MITNTPSSLCVILYEGQDVTPLDEVTRYDVICAILNDGYEVIVCKENFISELDAKKKYVVLSQFPDAFTYPGERTEGSGMIAFETLANNPTDRIQPILDQHRERAGLDKPGTWKPWFPVIDYERCANCLQCLSFCLFNVYGTDVQGSIKVQNPSQCKTDCPACSRVCPEAAIIFPKYKSGPINGDEVNENDHKREKMQVDLSSILGGNIYETLRDRKTSAKSRFSAERDEEKALEEKKRCLKELQECLDVPDAVLNSLPDLETIQAKAKQKQSSP